MHALQQPRSQPAPGQIRTAHPTRRHDAHSHAHDLRSDVPRPSRTLSRPPRMALHSTARCQTPWVATRASEAPRVTPGCCASTPAGVRATTTWQAQSWGQLSGAAQRGLGFTPSPMHALQQPRSQPAPGKMRTTHPTRRHDAHSHAHDHLRSDVPRPSRILSRPPRMALHSTA